MSPETKPTTPEVDQLQDAEWLSKRLGVPRSWINERTRTRSRDVIPHVRLGKYVRFNPRDPALLQWIARHRSNGAEVKADKN